MSRLYRRARACLNYTGLTGKFRTYVRDAPEANRSPRICNHCIRRTSPQLPTPFTSKQSWRSSELCLRLCDVANRPTSGLIPVPPLFWIVRAPLTYTVDLHRRLAPTPLNPEDVQAVVLGASTGSVIKTALCRLGQASHI